MRETGKTSRSSIGDVIAVSGGPDSVYLYCRTLNKSKSAIIAHLNHGARGLDSDKDQEFVEQLGRSKGIRVEVRKIALTTSSTADLKRRRGTSGMRFCRK
jgi:tRNA(Ile)-lysidine synthase